MISGVFAGCETAPTAPAVSPTTPDPPRESTVSGTVFEVTQELVRPLSGARVRAVTGWDLGDTSAVSDSAGRYKISGLLDPRGQAVPLWSLDASAEGYSQPCRPILDDWLTGTVDDVNIYLVSGAVLARGTPSHLPTTGPILSGTVLERGTRRPVAGAEVVVDFSHQFMFAGARTITDLEGRYTVCGLTQRYHVFWDEGAVYFPQGGAHLLSRRAADARFTIDRIDVRTLTHLDIEID